MADSMKCSLTAGSRDSKLALIQTNCIISALKEKRPNLECKIESMRTFGDEILHKALPKIGEKSLFTKDLEVALAAGRVDFLVHSLKDLPTTLPDGMAVGAIYKRDDPRDAVLFHPKHKSMCLADLPEGSVIGTSSLRRIAQLRRRYPHLVFENVRGNLNTRLRKLEEDSKYDALVLAAAGVHRMNWTDKIGQVLSKQDCMYAVGQGALGVEVKIDDSDHFSLFGSITDLDTLLCCVTEREFMRQLEGGCSVPIGVWCEYKANELHLTGAVLSLDGSTCLEKTLSCGITTPESASDAYMVTESQMVINRAYEAAVRDAEELGCKVASCLKEQGACEILKQARELILITENDLKMPMKS